MIAKSLMNLNLRALNAVRLEIFASLGLVLLVLSPQLYADDYECPPIMEEILALRGWTRYQLLQIRLCKLDLLHSINALGNFWVTELLELQRKSRNSREASNGSYHLKKA